ncbi:ribonuclease HII, partial [Salmonella sp. SAL4359]|uniref:ribonuclease HII n=1 Tax=Salmonella sp. SAL4359 TaxID=3159880 RepID=UPI00397A1070
VGRGCLAGPVLAAAVVLDPDRRVPGLRDSKLLTPLQRERLCAVITRRALGWAVSLAEPVEIDEVNIHRATLRAMQR